MSKIRSEKRTNKEDIYMLGLNIKSIIKDDPIQAQDIIDRILEVNRYHLPVTRFEFNMYTSILTLYFTKYEKRLFILPLVKHSDEEKIESIIPYSKLIQFCSDNENQLILQPITDLCTFGKAAFIFCL